MRNTIILASAALATSQAARAGTMLFEPGSTVYAAGGSGSVVIRLADVTAPLFGYSLDLRISPAAGADGTIVADLARTHFFDSENLISAGGATRDPLFSVILPTARGVFISSNTSDGSAVSAEPGVNDVLAELFFTISADAEGEFLIDLGPASVLSGPGGNPVAFEFTPLKFMVVGNVIPAPGAPVMTFAVWTALTVARRRRGHGVSVRRG